MFNFLFFVLTFLSSVAQAKEGGSVGNGGGAWVCRNSNSNPQWVRTVDLFEAENEFGLTITRNDQLPSDMQLKQIRTAVKIVNAQFETALGFALKRLKTSHQMVVDVELNITDDSLFRIKPAKKTCPNGTINYEQLANFTEYGKILIDRELFQKLSNTEQTALWLHEAIYLLERERKKATNSVATRKLVGYLMSNTPAEDYQELLDGYNSGKCDLCVPDLKPGLSFSEGLAAFKGENDLFGYQDKTGKVVIKPRFLDAGKFQKGAASVRFNFFNLKGENEPRSALINRTGKILYQSEKENFLMGSGTREGTFSVYDDFASPDFSRPLLLDATGKILLKSSVGEEETISQFNDHSAVLKNYRKKECTYIDEKGSPLFKLSEIYDCAPFSEGFAVVLFEKNLGMHRIFSGHSGTAALVNRKGEIVLKFTQQFEWGFSEMAGPMMNGLFRSGDRIFLNAAGEAKIQLPTEVHPVNDYFIDGLLLVEETEPYAKLSLKSPEGTNREDSSEPQREEKLLYRHFLYQTNGEKMETVGAWANIGINGYIETYSADSRTAWASDTNLKDANLKYLPVMNDQGKWGYIDRKGNTMVPFLFNEAHPFFDGMAATDLGYISLDSLEN